MTGVTMELLKDKLKLFLGEVEVEETLNKIITSSGLARKDFYSGQETEKLLEAMIAVGGFVEFTARNIKVSLLLRK